MRTRRSGGPSSSSELDAPSARREAATRRLRRRRAATRPPRPRAAPRVQPAQARRAPRRVGAAAARVACSDFGDATSLPPARRRASRRRERHPRAHRDDLAAGDGVAAAAVGGGAHDSKRRARDGGADAAAVARVGKAAAAHDPEAATQLARLSNLPLHTWQPLQHDPPPARRARPPRPRKIRERARRRPRHRHAGSRVDCAAAAREGEARGDDGAAARARQRGAEAGGAVGGASVRAAVDARQPRAIGGPRFFAAARAGEKGRVESALKKHPELLLVRAERGSRQTIVHAVAEGGSVALLQEVVKKVAEATLGRIASLHEATVLCLQDPRLLDVRRASPLHAAAAAGQLDSVQWLLAKAQNQSFDGRSYTDLPVLKELLGLADADGRTPLHAALYAAGAADASVERRAPGVLAAATRSGGRRADRTPSGVERRRRRPPSPRRRRPGGNSSISMSGTDSSRAL